MNTRKILLNSLLALGLAGIGSAYAAEEVKVQTREEIQAQHRAETAGMTEEEREQYMIQQREKMTDEQRAALRAESQQNNAEQQKGKGARGNGTQLRDGSGGGSQRGGGQGMGGGMKAH